MPRGECIADYEVYNNTVGQFTGLHDKDGKEIYEGDILQWKGDTYVVKFTQGMFYASVMKKGHIGGFPLWYLAMEYHYSTSIIGNIHNNPELLKGGKSCKE